MSRSQRAARALGALALGGSLLLAGCSTPDSATRDGSNVLLLVNEITGVPGDDDLEDSNFLLSDVDPVFNDNAVLTLESVPKNQQEGLTLGSYDTVQLERYTVRFIRSDGRNTEGVDVPYSFQGPLGGIVAPFTETEIAFVLVRHQAKREPPLRNLVDGGGARVISTFAEIDIYGRTLGGDVVTTRATIGVTFADFGS